MKEKELRQHATCSRCGKPVGANRQIQFFVVTVQPYVFNLGAMARQDGLAAMLGGNSALAAVMGADEDMANAVGDPERMSVCQGCAIESGVLSLVESASSRRAA